MDLLEALCQVIAGWDVSASNELNRHKLTMPVLIADLNQKLRGHYAYYGISFNSRKINTFFYLTTRLLHKWLNHRGGKRVWSWEKVAKLTTEWIPLEKPRIYHSYRLAKP